MILLRPQISVLVVGMPADKIERYVLNHINLSLTI